MTHVPSKEDIIYTTVYIYHILHYITTLLSLRTFGTINVIDAHK
jgi:hypothetical protein